MKFRTEIKITDAPKILSPERHVLLMGSCFSDNIGARLVDSGWPATVNPCGVIYNPTSLALLFNLALANPALRRNIVSSSITEREGKFVSWFMGSKASGVNPETCIDNVCECLELLEKGIDISDCIILTFGTSDVWLLKGSDRAVGNCHKHPAAEFERRRLGINEIVAVWEELISAIKLRNPGVKIIVTVSPRRYLSDGFAENTRQKAVLILACEALCKKLKDVFYFPSFEILNDDLRDYRFYTPDLLHPSEQAIEYIWEKFTETYLDQEAGTRLERMEKVARRKRHRPINSD